MAQHAPSQDPASGAASTQRFHELLSFPCDFELKVMGLTAPNFAQEIVALIQPFDPSFDGSKLEMRPSREGKYVSLSCRLHATSGDQLYAIYAAVKAHPSVKVAL